MKTSVGDEPGQSPGFSETRLNDSTYSTLLIASSGFETNCVVAWVWRSTRFYMCTAGRSVQLNYKQSSPIPIEISIFRRHKNAIFQSVSDWPHDAG